MKKLNLILAIAAMSIFSTAVFARAQDTQSSQQPNAQSGTGHGHGAGEGRGRGMMMSPDAMLEHMSKELNLTDDQKAKIKPILEEQSKQMQDARTSTSDQDRRAKMKQIHENTMSQIRPILNSDQQKKLEEMMSHRGERGEGHQHSGDTSNPQ